MPNWVFRRPSRPARRRFVPYGKRNDALVFPQRRTGDGRRRVFRKIRRRSTVVGHARHDALVFVRRALATLRTRRVVRIHRRAPPVHGTPAPAAGQGQVFARMLRAVGKIRRAMRRRLFWRPPPEIIPAPPVDRVTVRSAKGRIFCPGLVRGRIEEEVS